MHACCDSAIRFGVGINSNEEYVRIVDRVNVRDVYFQLFYLFIHLFCFGLCHISPSCIYCFLAHGAGFENLYDDLNTFVQA